MAPATSEHFETIYDNENQFCQQCKCIEVLNLIFWGFESLIVGATDRKNGVAPAQSFSPGPSVSHTMTTRWCVAAGGVVLIL